MVLNYRWYRIVKCQRKALRRPRPASLKIQAGCDELVLLPCAADPDQVHLLADAIF